MNDLTKNLTNLFQLDLRRRWTEDLPHSALEELIVGQQEHYIKMLKGFVTDAERMADIAPSATPDSFEPGWKNEWIEGLDVISLYGYVKSRRANTYLEIGSGYSTMFVRRAIRDHGLPTRLVSIDPEPRAGIDRQCDEIIRSRLENVPLRPLFSQLAANDIVFFDGSHRCFQNSDVTVFFTEILPMIPSGVLIGIHDIFLPADYTPMWFGRFYSEQYLLACWLLADGGHRLRIELPVSWIGTAPSAGPSRQAIAPLYKKLPAGIPMGGGAFWISKK